MDLPTQTSPDEPGEVMRRRRKGIYVLPNAITLAALFSAFYGIVMAIDGRFEAACIAVFVAAVLDSLDGRVARMTHSQSAFGEQMDSLSDMVAFGAAPALIVYIWALKDMGKLGWIPAFAYLAGAALRLARFNVNIGVVDKRFFQGLPSPAAAALVVGLVWVMDDAGFKAATQNTWLAWLAFGVTLYAGLSMVTNAPFYSFKVVGGRRSVPFVVLVGVALAIVLIALDTPRALFSIFCLYGLSGYAVYAWRRFKGKPVSVIATSIDEPEEKGLHR
ncbi:MAG: phosphatidylcholine/phosphatidylserine synthase [Rubrivivax sp.]|nr:phosphatidylcholine/phosphatidylserine synthase [Rubrivivax sp.]